MPGSAVDLTLTYGLLADNFVQKKKQGFRLAFYQKPVFLPVFSP